MKFFTVLITKKLVVNRFPPGFHWAIGEGLVNPMVKKFWKNPVICALSPLFCATHSNLLVFCAQHRAKVAVSLTAPDYEREEIDQSDCCNQGPSTHLHPWYPLLSTQYPPHQMRKLKNIGSLQKISNNYHNNRKQNFKYTALSMIYTDRVVRAYNYPVRHHTAAA